MPSASSSSCGYPTELATMEIVDVCVRYACEKAHTTTLKTIVLMDVDALKHSCFVNALWAAAERSPSGNTPEGATDLDIRPTYKQITGVPFPVLPPPSPFEHLSPDDPEYRRVLAELVPGLRDRVVSICRVRASPRHDEYEKTKFADPRAHVTEIEHLYHGTPERWRATAIALNGFNLRTVRFGRSLGNGVYTSTKVSTAAYYLKGSGSLLRLRGLIVSYAKRDTIISGDIHVFPNTKALLSLMIIDFAAEDDVSLDRKQVQRL